MLQRNFVVVALALLVLPAAACGTPDLPPERHANAVASINERQIRASIMDDDLAVDVSVDRRGSGAILRGRLEIALTDVATGEEVSQGSGSAAVAQRAATGTHRVVFAGAGEGLERADAGPMILAWRFVPQDQSAGDLYGKTSLYAALGNLDVQLRGPTELPSEGSSPLRVLVRDPASGAPIEGADVTALLVVTSDSEAVEHALFEGVTGPQGELLSSIALPEGVDAGSLRVTVSHEGVQVWTSRAVERRADDQLYLGTDKTIYQPGQDVHLRLLALSGPDRLPVAGAEAVFEARDGRGNKVWRRTSRTDEFGVAAAIMPTDTRVNEGEWTLSAQIAGRQTQLRIPVEAYTLPRMRVSVSADRSFALPGQRVRGGVSASYLFGEPVRGASVTIEARTASGVELGTLFATTDAQGMASYELLVPETIRTAALEESGDALLLAATVTDTAGQIQAGEGSLALAAAPLRINTVGDGELRAGEEGLVYVIVTDAVGRPLVADVQVTGGADATLATNASGVGELHFTPASDTVSLEVSATDGAGRTHARTFSLGASSGDARLRVATDRAVYQPGETARLRVTAGSGVERAWLDVYRGATGVLSVTVELTDGSSEIDLPITDELGGLLVVDAFAVEGDGTTLRAARPLLVERDDRLQVVLGADRSTYEPGGSAQIDVQVSDASGAPRVASVGLTVVDEAVFALGGEPRTSIRSSFGLDERVLPSSLSVAGRGPSDLLNAGDPADREQLARLLFASATGTGGPNFAYGSLAEEVPRVVSSLSRKLTHDGQAYLEQLQPLVDRGVLTQETIADYVQRARTVDPFGRAYRLSVEGTEPWEMQLVLQSSGPDEERGTADDLVGRLAMGWVFYGASRGGWEDEAAFGAGGPPMDGAEAPAPDPSADGASGEGGQARVRRDFRETALVQPMLITDATGRATVTVPLAQSITTWRVSADGSSMDGRVGATRGQIRTFQPFFVDFSLPPRLTSGDELDVPAVVYNYTSEPQRVTVTMADGDWFELLGAAVQSVDLGPSEVRAARFRIRITRAGSHELSLTGSTGSLGDTIVRAASVLPAGQPEDETHSGRLEPASPRTHRISLPSDTVTGGGSIELVLTPGFAAEAVQGVESLLREPNGCFEQTTSTAWPNTLVAKYLEAAGELTPERREEVIAMVTRGYQRLLTFESPTGGFNWWGDSDPGNRILSAIMLWHLKDMEGLIETDASVRQRTLEWLLAQQQADGSWEPGDALHSGNEVLGTSRERTTAFITWALAHTGWADAAVSRASGWLRAHLPPASDLYANALTANALAISDPRGAVTGEVFARLDGMRVDLDDGGGILWPTETPSWTGSAGDAAAVETTGLVAYGMIRAGAFPDAAEGAMRFILANKDAVGTWYNTQATMNALRALSVALTGGSGDADGTLVVTVDGVEAARIPVNADNRDLHRRFDLSLFATAGAHDVQLAFSGTGQVSYRLTRRAYRPVLPAAAGPLSLTVTHDRTTTTVGSPVHVVARATNGEASGARDQVIVRVGTAPGFAPSTDDLDGIVAAGLASRYEVSAEGVVFYLMNLTAGETRELRYRIVPGLPVDATAPASRVYAYYEPTLQQTLPAVRFTVTSP